MTLLIIQPRLSYYSGGGELMPLDLIAALLKNNIFKNITLVTTKPIDYYSSKYIGFKKHVQGNNSIKILELEVPEHFKYIYQIDAGEDRSRWDLESLNFTRMITDSEILLHNFTHCLSFYILDGLFIPKRTKNILYLLGYPKESNEIRKQLLSTYDIILANNQGVVSNWQKDMLESQFNCVQVLLQGLDFVPYTEVTPFEYDDNFKNIVFVGRLIERKGILDLIEAVSILVKKGLKIKLHIYGEGPLKERLISTIESFNLSNSIILHGFQSNIPSRLINADVCCYPSHAKEGLMSSVLEGMYYNGLVITTTNNGSEAVIDNEKSGFLVLPNSSEELAFAIDKTLKLSIHSKNNIRENARVSIIDKCNWNTFARRFKQIVKPI